MRFGSWASAAIRRFMSQRTQVASVDVVAFPLSRTLRFRDSNLEAVNLVNSPGDLDGVLANDKGEVLALWSSFAFETQRELEQVNRGIPADLVTEMINVVEDGPAALFVRGGVQCAIVGERAQIGVARRLGAAIRGARPAAPAGARHRSIGCRDTRRHIARAGRLAARHRRQGRQSVPRSGARRAKAAGVGHGLARRRGENSCK